MTNSTAPAPTMPAPSRATFRAPGVQPYLTLTRDDLCDLAGDANARIVELFGVIFTMEDN